MKLTKSNKSLPSASISTSCESPDTGSRVPFTRACSLFPFVSLLQEIGAPTERLLARSHIPTECLDNPESLVPLHFAHRFVELAASREGIEDLGMQAAQRASAFELGECGRQLQKALTVYDYIQTGMRLIRYSTSGSRFWLSPEESGNIRVNQFSAGQKGAGHCQGDNFTLMITIGMLRHFAAGQWSPQEIALLHGNDQYLGDIEALADAEIVTDQRHSSFTLPVSLLQQPIIRRSSPASDGSGEPQQIDEMPTDFVGSIESLVATLLREGYPEIHLAAEAAGMSKRTLQRRLTEAGQSYSAIVNQTRLRLAARHLADTDMEISEIAASLGYKDASNLTRAFRTKTGMTPTLYRQKSTLQERT